MRNGKISLALGVLLAVLLWTQPTSGQLPGASPATLGTANNYTVLARGFAAVGLNPAGLGMPGNPGFSLALLPVKMSQSLDPLSLSDFAKYGGVVVPTSVKEDWLQRIATAGGQTGSGALEITPASFSWSNFGVQLSTIASGRTSLNQAAAELLLFGNAGRTGEAGDFDLSGSGLSGYAVTTLGVSAGFPIARRWVPGLEQGLSIGATLKQSWGHVLAFGEDAGTLAQSNPLELDVDFPVVHPDTERQDWSRGSGLGLDVGVAWERGPWAAAAVIQNLFHTFEWDQEKLVYRPGQAVFDADTNEVDFDERPVTEAPSSLQDKVKDLTFNPVLVLGGAYDVLDNLTVTAEFRQRTGDGLDIGPKMHLGVGMEYRPAPSVPLRAGIAAITDGFQLGGGLGLILGPVHIGIAGLYQTGDVGDGMAGTFGLSFGG
ncbi:MAG: conjugal transfer protein TraF [Gemmatimonadota bacterium]